MEPVVCKLSDLWFEKKEFLDQGKGWKNKEYYSDINWVVETRFLIVIKKKTKYGDIFFSGLVKYMNEELKGVKILLRQFDEDRVYTILSFRTFRTQVSGQFAQY